MPHASDGRRLPSEYISSAHQVSCKIINTFHVDKFKKMWLIEAPRITLKSLETCESSISNLSTRRNKVEIYFTLNFRDSFHLLSAL